MAFHFPAIVQGLFLSALARSWTFFCCSNPGFQAGGFGGESKFRILQMLPTDAVIPTLYLAKGGAERSERVLAVASEQEWSWPLVLKPDVGQRGIGVGVVKSAAEVEEWLANHSFSAVAQPYHSGPYEVGVFYVRFPKEAVGRIVSVTEKVSSFVTGDGTSTVDELVARAAIEKPTRSGVRYDFVPEEGEQVDLFPVRNLARGVVLKHRPEWNTESLGRKIDEVSKAVTGFYIGRYDLRFHSLEKFVVGEEVAVVELNGVTAVDLSIFDPTRSLLSAWWTLLKTWRVAWRISRQTRRIQWCRPEGARSVIRFLQRQDSSEDWSAEASNSARLIC